MPSSFGSALRVSVFGQSHSPAVGCVVEGLPAGLSLDLDELRAFVARRAPGNDPWSTPRREPDEPRIVSGLNVRGETCGAPLAAIIENTNTRSADYDNLTGVPRPGHADFTAWAKWHGAQDVPGGGHFSGRLTGPLCVAGGVRPAVAAHARRHPCARTWPSSPASPTSRSAPSTTLPRRPSGSPPDAALADGRRVPVIDEAAGERMVEAVMAARAQKDTVGGIVECVACGLPAGAGSPMFDASRTSWRAPCLACPRSRASSSAAASRSPACAAPRTTTPYEGP